MHARSILMLLLAASMAVAASPPVTLPPSERWEEVAAEAGAPAQEGASRAFRLREAHEVTLRVATQPGRRLDYTAPVVRAMAERLVAEAVPPAALLEAVSTVVGAAKVGKIVLQAGPARTVLYLVPADDGDQVLTLSGAHVDPRAEEELAAVVGRAQGLREAAPTASGMDMGLLLLSLAGALLLAVIGFLFIGLRRRSKRTGAA